MKNFVISLTTANDRRQHIKNEFSKQGIDFEFFDAITPLLVDDLAKKFQINIKNANLTQGELACLLSHISLWQKAIDDNLPFIGIFEDDIYLSDNSSLFLSSSDWIPEECRLIKLEMFDQYAHMNIKPLAKHHNHALRKLNQIHLGAAGYILSHQMCIFLMDFIKNYPEEKGIVASDHILFEDYLNLPDTNIYQITPALCAQSDRIQQETTFASSLEKERRIRLNSQKSTAKYKNKIHREIMRVVNQIISLGRNSYIKLFCYIPFK